MGQRMGQFCARARARIKTDWIGQPGVACAAMGATASATATIDATTPIISLVPITVSPPRLPDLAVDDFLAPVPEDLQRSFELAFLAFFVLQRARTGVEFEFRRRQRRAAVGFRERPDGARQRFCDLRLIWVRPVLRFAFWHVDARSGRAQMRSSFGLFGFLSDFRPASSIRRPFHLRLVTACSQRLFARARATGANIVRGPGLRERGFAPSAKTEM